MVAPPAEFPADPTLAEAHSALGLLDFVDWDWKEAEREYERAMELNPSYDRPYIRLGVLRFYDGDRQNAEHLMMQAESLSPYSLSLPAIRAEVYYYWRQYADSEKLARKVEQIDPHNGSALAILACDYWQQGDSREALDTVRKLHEADPTFQLDLMPCVAGVGSFGKQVIAAAVSPHERNPYVLAIIASASHDREGVLTGLEKAVAEHSPDMPGARFEPDFDFVRGDRRFQAVMAKVWVGGNESTPPGLTSSRSHPAKEFFQTGFR